MIPASIRVYITALVLCSAAFCSAGDGEEFRGKDKETGCRFELPASWHFTTLKWTGRCSKRHVAEGHGVLRAYQDGKATESFFGEFSEGHLASGAIETDSGYLAGKFAAGRPLENPERNDLIAAFETAALGATQASEAFKRKGNSASSSYYSEKARQLRMQMD